MGGKAIYKSGINFGHFQAFFLILCFLRVLVSIFLNDHMSFVIMNIVQSALIFFSFSVLINQFIFYDNYIIIYYFFRFWKKRNLIKYENIEYVKYSAAFHSYSPPTIRLFIKKNKFRFNIPSNSCPVYSFKKRKKILNFLAEKGLTIKIVSDETKDINILN